MSEHEVKVKRLKPIPKAHLHDVPLPAINTPLLSKNIHPKHHPTGIRITVAISVPMPGILSAIITRKGDVQTVALNKANALVSGAIYVFEFMVHNKDRVNFSFSQTNGTIQILRVEEVDAATAVGTNPF